MEELWIYCLQIIERGIPKKISDLRNLSFYFAKNCDMMNKVVFRNLNVVKINLAERHGSVTWLKK